jgi:hypothetical protein
MTLRHYAAGIFNHYADEETDFVLQDFAYADTPAEAKATLEAKYDYRYVVSDPIDVTYDPKDLPDDTL